MLRLTSFNGSYSDAAQYTVLILEGRGFRPTSTISVHFKFLAHAIISKDVAAPFLLGADIIHEQNIVAHPDTQTITLFRKDPITIPFTPWSQVKSHLNDHIQQQIISINSITSYPPPPPSQPSTVWIPVHNRHRTRNLPPTIPTTPPTHPTLRHIIDTLNTTSHRQFSLLQHFKRLTHTLLAPLSHDTRTHLTNTIVTIINRDPQGFLDSILPPYKLDTIIGLIFLHEIYNPPGTQQLLDTLKAQVSTAMQQVINILPATTDSIPFSRILTAQAMEIANNHLPYNLPTLTQTYTITAAIETLRTKCDDTDMDIVQAYKAQIKPSTDPLTDPLRPTLFPPDLWIYTHPNQRPLVLERWRQFTDSRIQEILPIINDIDICTSTPSRLAEQPLFLAQNLCNIDIYAYPDPNKPPQIKGREIVIHLKDNNCIPCNAKPQRRSILENFSIFCRCLDMKESHRMRSSRSDWSSPIVTVPNEERIKAHLDKHQSTIIQTDMIFDITTRRIFASFYRMTGNYKYLNECTIQEKYPLPLIMDLLDRLGNGKDRFSAGDLEDGFFNLSLAESCRYLTAHQTKDEHVEYNVMPQGIMNAACEFARVVDDIFRPLFDKDIVVYQDDITNCSKHLANHLANQQAVYDRMRANNILFKISKTHLNYPTMKILGHVITKDGRCADPGIIKAITDLAIPTNTSEVRSLLGLAQVAREYMAGLSDLIAPLQFLTRKGIDVPTSWTDEHTAAFNNLKKVLTTLPVLRIPSTHDPYRIHVDACRVGRGLGAILLQQNEFLAWQVVAYWSRGLTAAERNYSATDLECTALHDAILHFKIYVRNGRQFEVITDHYALVYLVAKLGGDSHQRLARICMDLQDYTFTVTHRPGNQHLDADAVSRLLRKDDIPFIWTESTLRTDRGPLTSDNMEDLKRSFPNDSDFLIAAIKEHERNLKQPTKPPIITSEPLPSPEITPNPKAPTTISATIIHSLLSSYITPCIGPDWTTDLEESTTPEVHHHIIKPILKRNTNTKILTYYTNLQHTQPIIPLTTNQNSINLHLPLPKASNITLIAPDILLARIISGFQSQLLHTSPNPFDILSLDDIFSYLLTTPLSQLQPLFVQLFPYQTLPSKHTIDYPNILSLLAITHYLLQSTITLNPYIITAYTLLHRILITSTGKFHRQQDVLHTMHPTNTSDAPWEAYNALTSTILLYFHSIIYPDTSLPPEVTQYTSTPPTDSNSNNPHSVYINTARSQIVAANMAHRARARDQQEAQALRPVRKTVRHIRNKPSRNHRKLRAIRNIADLVPTTPTPKPPQNYRQVIPPPPNDPTMRLPSLSQAENIDHQVEDYEYLIHQHYVHPTTLTLYEIFNVYYNFNSKRFESSAIPQVDERFYLPTSLQDTTIERRRLTGTTGTIQLVRQLTEAQTDAYQRPWPITTAQWLDAQQDDPDNIILLQSLPNSDSTIPYPQSNHRPNTLDDVFTRLPTHDNTLGPLIRKIKVTKTLTHRDNIITTNKTLLLIIVPTTLIASCLFVHHACMGHPGRKRMLNTIKLHYHWPTIVQDVTNHTKTCQYCTLRKANNLQPNIPIMKYNMALHPFHRTHIDITGPLIESPSGNVYILVVKDALTKWVELFPLKSKTMDTIATTLVDEIFTRYGPIRFLVSDRGSEFTNSDIRAICACLLTQQILTTANNPRSDGQAENHMRTIKDMLSAFLNKQHTNWDTYLTVLRLSYNTTVNDATGLTPFSLLFGHECPQPNEDHLRDTQMTPSEYAEGLRDTLIWTWEHTSDRINRNSDNFNRIPRTRLQFQPYSIGDFFFLRRIPRRFYSNKRTNTKHLLSSKLQPRWTGPYRILEVLSPILYRADIHNHVKTVHAINMKPALT
jgi:hypothetical protein